MTDLDDKIQSSWSESSSPPVRSVRFSGSTSFPSASLSKDDSGRNLRKRPRPQLKRTNSGFDLETGCESQRQQSINLIASGDNENSSKNLLRPIFQHNSQKKIIRGASMMRNGQEMGDGDQKVYRIRAKTTKRQYCTSMSGRVATFAISEYVRWAFRASFFAVGCTSYFFFLLFIMFFAVWIYMMGVYQPQCIWVLEKNFAEGGYSFMDAFHLSWITFSTVGYGVVAPTIPEDIGKDRCVGINVLMAFEAFLGVLFAAITLSIIFAKVARIQSVAQVRFSDPICVQYGTGVMSNQDDITESDELPDHEPIQVPCPILEFRLINEQSATKGGEIVDASVSVVGVTLAEVDKADEEYYSRRASAVRPSFRRGSITGTLSLLGASKSSQGSHASGSGAPPLLGASKSMNSQASGGLVQKLNHHFSRRSLAELPIPGSDAIPYSTEPEGDDSEDDLDYAIASFAKKYGGNPPPQEGAADKIVRRNSVAVDEGDSKLVPPHIFHKLEIETDRHPFFKRVWNIRHRLNHESPLLSKRARRLISNNKGHWPAELDHFTMLRSNLNFKEIIVNFSGTANVSSNSVFAVHVYDYVDVNVGYTFAQALARNDKGRLIADIELINDVTEQRGGGGEPFTDVIDPKVRRTGSAVAKKLARDAAAAATDAASMVAGSVEFVIAKLTGAEGDGTSRQAGGPASRNMPLETVEEGSSDIYGYEDADNYRYDDSDMFQYDSEAFANEGSDSSSSFNYNAPPSAFAASGASITPLGSLPTVVEESMRDFAQYESTRDFGLAQRDPSQRLPQRAEFPAVEDVDRDWSTSYSRRYNPKLLDEDNDFRSSESSADSHFSNEGSSAQRNAADVNSKLGDGKARTAEVVDTLSMFELNVKAPHQIETKRSFSPVSSFENIPVVNDEVSSSDDESDVAANASGNNPGTPESVAAAQPSEAAADSMLGLSMKDPLQIERKRAFSPVSSLENIPVVDDDVSSSDDESDLPANPTSNSAKLPKSVPAEQPSETVVDSLAMLGLRIRDPLQIERKQTFPPLSSLEGVPVVNDDVSSSEDESDLVENSAVNRLPRSVPPEQPSEVAVDSLAVLGLSIRDPLQVERKRTFSPVSSLENVPVVNDDVSSSADESDPPARSHLHSPNLPESSHPEQLSRTAMNSRGMHGQSIGHPPHTERNQAYSPMASFENVPLVNDVSSSDEETDLPANSAENSTNLPQSAPPEHPSTTAADSLAMLGLTIRDPRRVERKRTFSPMSSLETIPNADMPSANGASTPLEGEVRLAGGSGTESQTVREQESVDLPETAYSEQAAVGREREHLEPKSSQSNGANANSTAESMEQLSAAVAEDQNHTGLLDKSSHADVLSRSESETTETQVLNEADHADVAGDIATHAPPLLL